MAVQIFMASTWHDGGVKTALKEIIDAGKIAEPNDRSGSGTFCDFGGTTLEANGFIHYELSSFGKENCFSKNNSACGKNTWVDLRHWL
jgi:hypothetical protein